MHDDDKMRQIQVVLDALYEGADLLDTLEQVPLFDGHERSILKDAHEMVCLVREIFIDRRLIVLHQENPRATEEAAASVEDGSETMENVKRRVYQRMMKRMGESNDPMQQVVALQRFDPEGEVH